MQAEPSNKTFNSKNHQEIEEVLCSRQTMKTQMIQKSDRKENKEEKSSFNPQPSKEIQNFFYFFISFQKRTTRVLSDPLLAARLRFESAWISGKKLWTQKIWFGGLDFFKHVFCDSFLQNLLLSWYRGLIYCRHCVELVEMLD